MQTRRGEELQKSGDHGLAHPRQRSPLDVARRIRVWLPGKEPVHEQIAGNGDDQRENESGQGDHGQRK